ncbi:hypothetical protein S420910_113 [Synechococcus phage S-CAM7]|uniref:Uncharacterized protein n=1 Tax=Synechococcus phage S-CAM7 TaxID=1883368 RepID=A0A1D8KUK4_9CAUD|nr:hypothetical protein S420910_113 [Synechococcus phage S-CAM7]
MPFSPACRLSDQTRVWVERSIYEGCDWQIEKHFGPAQGQDAQTIAARFAATYSEEGKTMSLANPCSGIRAED